LRYGSAQVTGGSCQRASLARRLPPGCALHTSIDALALRTTGTSGLDTGYASVTLPFDLSMTGVRVYAQWLLFGPGNSWPGGLTRPLSWQLAL
jgi:hypothetical protein